MIKNLAGMRWAAALIGLAPALIAVPAAAQTLDSGNVAWVLSASALVLFMTLPGLALFYGGLVRSRNLLSVLMHCFVICCLVSVIWAVFGYALAFGEGSPWIGGLAKSFLQGMAPVQANTLPEPAFVMFQMTFAIITPALIIGAFPERVSFPFVVLFSALWLVLVYLPVAHWVWGGGWAQALGVLDFAGGIVVHTTAGISALVVAIMVGARRGFPGHLIPPHSPMLTMTGAGMLWVGWFGFNGGSALAANGQAASAILATHLAAATAALVWTSIEWVKVGKPTSVGLVTGAVAGLATVTPASGFVGPMGAILLGVLAGSLCFGAVMLIKQRFHIDDSLDVFGVHGVGGILGSLLVAVLAMPSFGGSGLAEGVTWSGQLGVQAGVVLATALWSGLATWIIVKLVGFVTKVRVEPEAEVNGLDISAHGERAYDLT
jgi:Amt family ammonium transporter